MTRSIVKKLLQVVNDTAKRGITLTQNYNIVIAKHKY